jgi:acetate kinase
MGFTPLEGLVMSTRAGDVDSGLLTFLQRAEALTPDALERLVTHDSGLLGLAGDGDMRVLLARNDAEARLAVDIYCYRASKYIGAYLGVLGGVDAILFGGGVGEHAAPIRAKILRDLEWLGIALDEAANRSAVGVEARISRGDCPVEVWVIAVDEAQVLARAALALDPAKGMSNERKDQVP